MKRKLLALALGLVLASLLLAGVLWRQERIHRAAEEANVVMAVSDPVGLKYAYRRNTSDGRQRGWVVGQAPAPRAAGMQRVLAVGDSITWGMGVELDQAWPAQLDRLLPGAEVINLGMLGYDAEQVVTLVEHTARAWEPDLVVWATYTNDVAPTFVLSETNLDYMIYVGSTVPEYARRLPEPITLWLLARSALLRRVQADWYAQGVRGRQPTEPSLGWYQDQLERLVSWSESSGVPVLTLAVPDYTLGDLERCRRTREEQLCSHGEREYARLTAALEASPLPWIDGQAAYATAKGLSLALPGNTHDLAHPNHHGQRALAQALAPAVRRALASSGSPSAGEEALPEPPSTR